MMVQRLSQGRSERAWCSRTKAGYEIFFSVLIICAVTATAHAQEPRTFRVMGQYDDIRFELNNAIIERGLNPGSNGNIGEMLDRTGADVGSTTKVYKAAEYISFCSAKLSRQMIEADPANLTFCPFVLVIYETVAKPGEVVVAYRPLSPRGSPASRATIAAADAMLESIAREATKVAR